MKKSLNRFGKSGKRDNEIVQGWDTYHRIATRIARQYLRFYFPTTEDLVQAAALAATIARFGLGDETRLGQLTRVLRQVLKQQATAYGMRQRQVRLPNGKKSTQTYRPEVPFADYEAELDDEPDRNEMEEWLESRVMIVGVGEWTRRQAHQLTDLFE